MRKKTKRLLSGLLSLAMALSLAVVSPAAEGSVVQAETANLLTGGEFNTSDSDSYETNWSPSVSSWDNYSTMWQKDDYLNVYNGNDAANAMSISQTVTVPAGIYQVSVDVKGSTSDSGLSLAVKASDRELVKSVAIKAASKSDYDTLSTSAFVLEESTEITVSISGDVAAGYWANLDNVVLSQVSLEKLELLAGGEFNTSDSDSYETNWSPSVSSWDNYSTMWQKDDYLNVYNGTDAANAMSISQTVTVPAGVYQVSVDVKGSTSDSGLSLTVKASDQKVVESVAIKAASESDYDTLSTSAFVLEESTEITVSISGDVTAGYWANIDNLLIYGKTNSDSEAYQSSSITVKKVSGLSSDFIKGVDISSYVAEVNSGVKFYNEDDVEVEGKSFIKTLADAGVNYIRLRVWNQPYVLDETTGEPKTDENGDVVYYGGGNNDIDTAVKICEYINAYNTENPDSTQIKVLVDLHYSDFWADPDKQTAPKAWKDMDITTKVTNVVSYTQDCIAEVAATGVTIGMVQIGNETNNGICGTEIPDVSNDESGNPIYTDAADSDYIKVFKAGCDAVKAYNEENGTTIKRVVHFTDPHTAGTFYAKLLKECGVDYDVYATSYYPYWHGSTTNLTEMLSNIADECDVEVMVAETQYIYTNDDYDGADNQAYEGKDNIELSSWPVSVQGQANEIRDVINAVASVGKSGIGMFYWEPAWLGVGDAYDEDGTVNETALAANKVIWNSYGSGWATDAAKEYDSSVKQWGGGGTNIENAALFDQNGKPLESLNVFKYVDYGATCSTASYYSYKALDSVEVTMGSDAATIKASLPEKATYYMNDDTSGEADIEWDESSITETVEKISKTSAIGKSYTISGTITVDDSEKKVKCTVRVEPVNLLVNGGFEDEVGEEWALSYAWQDSSGSNQHNGSKFLKFENKTEDLQTVTASQTVEITEPGVYEAKTFVQGEYEAGSRDGEKIYLTASIGDLYYESDSVVLAAWQNWQVPVVSNIVITQKMIQKGLNKVTVTASATIASGVWGSFDDFYLYKSDDMPADYVELKQLSVNKQDLTLEKGATAKLNVSYNPSDTNEKDIVWASSNSDVVTVEDGEIKAVAYGEAEITVTSQYDSDIKATCKVVVKEKEATVENTETPATTETPVTSNSAVAVGNTVQSVAGDKGTFTVTKAGTTPEVSYAAEKNATSVTIPATIKDANGVEYKVISIVADSFKGNKKLKSVTIGANVTSIPDNTFKGCTSLTSVTIPASVKTIGANAFSGDTKLKTVSMGSSVTTIGAKAFYNCKKLTKITIPKTVTKIGKQAFAKCKSLKTITIKSTKLTKSKVGSKAFKGIHAKATIKVPKSKLKAYKKLLKSRGVGSKAKFKKN